MTAPLISVGPPRNDAQGPVTRQLASDGAKPASNYLAAARRRKDRNYVPRPDIMDAE